MFTGYRVSLPSDVRDVALRLRYADLRELEASTGEDPVLVLRKSFCLSEECHTIIAKGEIAGMFGRCEQGVVWMVGSDRIRSITKTFVRQAREVVSRWLTQEPILWNCLDERNALHLRWVSWMGFKPTGRSYTFLDPSVRFLEYVLCAPHFSPSPQP